MTATHPEPTRAEYVTDVAYERTFTQELSPTLLRWVATLNGITPPPADDFDYCELGAGNGDTLVTLAASNPDARFLGVDFNPAHVGFANDLAIRGGVGNVRFLERDFEALLDDDLPDFDYIGAHGVMSWVSAQKRSALLAFAKAKLRPGGLLYVSYNALPGWAVMEPLRRLMLDHTASTPGTTVDRAREGLAFLQRLSDANAGYFTSHPTARAMLALMQKAGLPYIAHEYFHAHWHPMYFADVAHEMERHDLSYVGQLPLHLNLPSLALSSAIQSMVGGGDDRRDYETIKDFALNEFFRSDVYVKGPARASNDARLAAIRATSFGSLAKSDRLLRELRLPHYTVQFTGPLYDALIPAIAARVSTPVELARTPALAQFGAARIGDALLNLTLGGQVLPMRSRPTASARGVYRIALAHNRRVLDLKEPRNNNTPIVLASAITGTGITLTMMEAICLRLLVEDQADQREPWLRAFLASQPLRLVAGEDRTRDPDALVRAILLEFETFRERWADKLVELGVLDRTDST
ncbi:MAG: methyltransferase regulatory domain-containing protein [Polyangiales bacterium]